MRHRAGPVLGGSLHDRGLVADRADGLRRHARAAGLVAHGRAPASARRALAAVVLSMTSVAAWALALPVAVLLGLQGLTLPVSLGATHTPTQPPRILVDAGSCCLTATGAGQRAYRDLVSDRASSTPCGPG